MKPKVPLKSEVKKIMAKVSYMEYDNDDKKWVMFVTRKYGNVASESIGIEDLNHAKHLARLFLFEYPKCEAFVDSCDEWVMLIINTAD